MSSPEISEVVVEQWKDSPIVFHPGDAFVNLTSLCKPFNKRPVDFFKLESAKQFIAALNSEESSQFRSETSGNPASFFTVEGRNGGTWAHPDLALECARWLSPAFAIWTNRVIRGLLAVAPPEDDSELTPEERAIHILESVTEHAADAVARVLAGTLNPETGSTISSLCSQAIRAWEVRLRIRPLSLPSPRRGESAVASALGIVVSRMEASGLLDLEELRAELRRAGRSPGANLGWKLNPWLEVPLSDSRGRRFQIERRRTKLRRLYAVEFTEPAAIASVA